MPETPQPHLITNPADDVPFRDAVEAARREGQSPADLEAVLRSAYPRITVRARDLSGERSVVWYVYREGHWVARDDRDQR